MRIKVFGSTSNLGTGFDTLGLAINIYNVFELELSDEFDVNIKGYGEELKDREKNLFIKAYKRTCEIAGKDIRPFKLFQENNIPLARGLGSSATAIVGGIESACLLNDITLSFEEKLEIAFEFEPHPDNLLPSFLGGFIISSICNGRVLYQKLEFPEELKLVFVIPEIKVSTEEARKILPSQIPFKDAVGNIQRVSLLISSLINKNFDMLKCAVEDNLHEPFRSKFIPDYEYLKEECYKLGAKAVFISGSGPTVCILTLEGEDEIGKRAVEIFEGKGVSSSYIVTQVSQRGFVVEA